MPARCRKYSEPCYHTYALIKRKDGAWLLLLKQKKQSDARLGLCALALALLLAGCACAAALIMDPSLLIPHSAERTLLANVSRVTGAPPYEPAKDENGQWRFVSAQRSGDDWMLRLVNPQNPLPADYAPPELTTLHNGKQVDSRCYPALQRMMDDCRAAGCSPYICSAYRDYDYQASLFENKVERVMAEGYTLSQAEPIAAAEVNRPGHSEHQLGLALDIVDELNQSLDSTQQDTATQQWLIAHSWEYGFTLRYPPEKSDITGIIYEPWHYRYVGVAAATYMRDNDMCLEEYIALRAQ